jgi:alpha-glucosidase (family GH31 glycosyl hydrolase)
MKNRYRIEIYDDIKSNDLTINTDTFTDIQGLRNYMHKNISKFSTKVRAYVYDNQENKKVLAAFLPMETVQALKNKVSV